MINAILRLSVERRFLMLSLILVLVGVGVVLGSAIQGAGATRFTLLIDCSVVLLIQLPLSILAVYLFGRSQVSLWQVLVLTNVLFAFIYLHAYRRGRYLHKVV